MPMRGLMSLKVHLHSDIGLPSDSRKIQGSGLGDHSFGAQRVQRNRFDRDRYEIGRPREILFQKVMTGPDGKDSSTEQVWRLGGRPPPRTSVLHLERNLLKGNTVLGSYPSHLLDEFPDVARLEPEEEGLLRSLWRIYEWSLKRQGLTAQKQSRHPSEKDLYHLSLEIAERIPIPASERERLVELQHKIRDALVAEQVLTVRVNACQTLQIPFHLFAKEMPKREQVLTVSLPTAEKFLSFFCQSVRFLEDRAYEFLLKGVLLVEVCHAALHHPEWGQKLPREVSAEDLALGTIGLEDPYWEGFLRTVYKLFQVHQRENSDESFVRDFPKKTDLDGFFERICLHIGCSRGDFFTHILRRGTRWQHRGSDRLAYLPEIIRSLLAIRVRRPARILHSLFGEEFHWAFKKVPAEPSLRFRTDLSYEEARTLIKRGFGGLMHAARIARGWDRETFCAKVGERFPGGLGHDRFARVGQNWEPPSFNLLRAIVETCNQSSSYTPIPNVNAFLAAYPSFASLLPLRVRGSKGPMTINDPPTFPYEIVCPHRITGGVDLRQSSSRPLDRNGFAWLLKSHLARKGHSSLSASQVIPISQNAFVDLQKDPAPNRKVEIPERVTLRILCSNKGLDIPRKEAIRALKYSHWETNEIYLRVSTRTACPLFYLDQRGLRRLVRYLERSPDFPTSGEILFIWRSAMGVHSSEAEGWILFLPTQRELANAINISYETYESWEADVKNPSDKNVMRLVEKLGKSDRDGALLREAVLRRRESRP